MTCDEIVFMNVWIVKCIMLVKLVNIIDDYYAVYGMFIFDMIVECYLVEDIGIYNVYYL